MNKHIKYLLLSLALSIPVLLVYSSHFMSGDADSGKIPSGFLMYDAPYYMANARELTDDGGFHLMYSNPFSHDYQSERIYFQPHTVILGALLKLSGMDPAFLLFLFGMLSSVLFFLVIIQLLRHLHFLEKKRDYLILLLFCWGGGLFSLSGFGLGLINGQTPVTAFFGASLFEPSGGWWFLNLGRNLILPTEAFYHLVFFFCILQVLKKRFVAAFFAALLMSASHPFTGIELLLILLSWTGIEILISRARYKPILWFGAGLTGILVMHIAYYLVFLRQNPEHELLFTQWTLPWTLSGISIILAYGLVALFVVYRLIRMNFFENFRTQPPIRLFIIWFIVAFLLSNHDWFIKPIQPLHFTRGYIWSSLFLLAIPVLNRLLVYLDGRFRNKFVRFTLIGLLAGILLSDNVLWMTATAIDSTQNPTLFLSPDEVDLYKELNKEEYRGRLVVSADIKAGYRLTVYTPLRSWYSHMFNTPDNEQCLKQIRLLAAEGIVPEELTMKNPLFIFPVNSIPTPIQLDLNTIWTNNTYCILSY